MVVVGLQTGTVNLPAIGTISVAGIIILGGIIFFLARRKKTKTIGITV